MYFAGMSPWMLFAIAGLVCAVILRIVGSMFKEKRTGGAIVILLGSLAMIAIMFTNFRGGNATRILIDGVPLRQKDDPNLPPPPAIEQLDEAIEAHTTEQQTTISSGATRSSVSRTLRDAKANTKRALRSAKASVKRTLRHASRRAPVDDQIRTKPMSHLLTGVAIAAFLCVGYVFLDAATRGQFTWRLRMVAVVAFAAICVALQSLH